MGSATLSVEDTSPLFSNRDSRENIVIHEGDPRHVSRARYRHKGILVDDIFAGPYAAARFKVANAAAYGSAAATAEVVKRRSYACPGDVSLDW